MLEISIHDIKSFKNFLLYHKLDIYMKVWEFRSKDFIDKIRIRAFHKGDQLWKISKERIYCFPYVDWIAAYALWTWINTAPVVAEGTEINPVP